MLESEIVELRKAIEALTAALEKNPLQPLSSEVPKNQDEPPKNLDGVSLSRVSADILKDATLKASRAGHKDAIRKKLNEMGVSKLDGLSTLTAGPEKFYTWLNTLGEK